MNIRHYTKSQARKSSAWRTLFDAVDRVEPYWFSDGAMRQFDSTLVGSPFTQAHEGRTYWVEYQITDDGTLGYVVRSFDGDMVLMVGKHADARVALGSALFLSAR